MTDLEINLILRYAIKYVKFCVETFFVKIVSYEIIVVRLSIRPLRKSQN